jgi:hypothetical protein
MRSMRHVSRAKLELPRMARRAPGFIVIILRLYAVHGRDTSVRDASSRGRIDHGYAHRESVQGLYIVMPSTIHSYLSMHIPSQ